MYGRKAWDIVGYTYRAEVYCPECILVEMGYGDPENYITERELDGIAVSFGIHRTDEWTFDSDQFPKVIFSSQVENPEYCGHCGRDIGE